jgi:hypothetical protein
MDKEIPKHMELYAATLNEIAIIGQTVLDLEVKCEEALSQAVEWEHEPAIEEVFRNDYNTYYEAQYQARINLEAHLDNLKSLI